MASGQGGHWRRRAQELRGAYHSMWASLAGRNRSVHTKQKRLKTQPPGLPQGTHKTKLEAGEVCVCGSCSRGFKRGVK